MANYHISKSGKAELCKANKRPCPLAQVSSDLPWSTVKNILSEANRHAVHLQATGLTRERLREEQLNDLARRFKWIEKEVARKAEIEAEEKAIAEEKAARESDPEWLASDKGQVFLTRKKIDDNNGYHEFEALFDNDGNPVNAKLVRTKFGMAWMLFDKDDTNQEFVTGWFSPSKAKTLSRAVEANRRKGYYVGRTEEKAKMFVDTEVDRYSGVKTSIIKVYRDRKNPGEVRVLDNGQ